MKIKDSFAYMLQNNPEFIVAAVYAAGMACVKSVEAAHGIQREGSVGGGVALILFAGGLGKVYMKTVKKEEKHD